MSVPYPNLVTTAAIMVIGVLVSLFFGKARRAWAASLPTIIRFFALIALPVATIVGTLIWALTREFSFDEKIWQAIIAGVFIATGWLTTAIFGELGKVRSKAERLRDYHKAIYAEIGNALVTLQDREAGAVTLERMRGQNDFVPFVPREHNDHVYDAILGDIDALPRQTIDAIVGYYSLIKTISDFAEDMRGERFQTLEQDRRIAMYEDYLLMREQAFEFGAFALSLIKTFADKGAAATEAEARRLNSPDADRSGRSQGSA